MALPISGSSVPASFSSDTLVDVRDYGAKCDNGITDNSIAFQAAVDSLKASLSGLPYKGVVYIPSGTGSYAISKSIWVDASNIEIQADSWGSTVAMIGSKQPAFIFGISRVQGGLSPDATNRPDLFGKLDSSAVTALGQMWGLRTNGNSFVQFHATPLSAGAGTGLYNFWSDAWSQTPVLTVEFCIEPPDQQSFSVNANILGCGSYPQISPFTVSGDGNNPNTLAVMFRTSDIASDFENTVRRFDFSTAGATAPYKVAIQFDLTNAVCSAFVNGLQVTFTREDNLANSGPIPFTPNAGLTFVTNDCYPFMIGTQGLLGTYGVPTGVDLRVYGLRLSKTLRYQNNGAGQKQIRADSPQTPLNDSWAYFGNDSSTICWLQGYDNPATAGRNVTVSHGQAVYPGNSVGLLMHSVPELVYCANNAIRNISLTLGGAHGQTICVGAVYEFTIKNVKSVGGFHGVGCFNMGTDYNVYIDHCTLDGTDAGYYGAFQIMKGHDLYFLTSGRATMRYVGSAATMDNIFVSGPTPVAECIFKATSSDTGGVFTIRNMEVDFEGYTLSRAAIYCEAHPFAPATSLTLSDIFLGTVGASTPLIMLKDVGVEGPAFSPAWLSVDNLQAYTDTYLAVLDVDGPLWHGEIRGVALKGPPINHRQKWGMYTNIIIRDTKFSGPPNQYGWYNGTHVLEVRSPVDGQPTEYRCVRSGIYGTSNPPHWCGLNPLPITANGLFGVCRVNQYMTGSLT
jgi:hypothetical protein